MSISSRILFNVSLGLALAIFALHCVTIWIARFESLYPTLPAIAVLASFLLIFFFFTMFIMVLRGRGQIVGQEIGGYLMSLLGDRRLRIFLLLISLLGVGLHAWSKYYLTELRPITCISEIRFAWLEVNRTALPLEVRIASVLGHLLTSFAYLGMLVTSYAIGRSKTIAGIPRTEAILQLIFTLIGVIYSGFIGSRNAMLAFLAMNLVGVIIAMAFDRDRYVDAVSSWRSLVAALIVPFFGMFAFSSMIFSDRLFCAVPDALSKAHDQPVPESKIAAFHMAGYNREFSLKERVPDNGGSWRDVPFISMCFTCGSAVVYANHGIFNLSKVIASEERGAPILLGHINSWIRRAGFDLSETSEKVPKRVYGPGGVTLAGAAYHDFGFMGVVAIATILGTLFGQSILWMQSVGLRALVGAWLFCCLFYMLLVSSMFVGFAVLPFPFISFGVGAGFVASIFLKWRHSSSPPHCPHLSS